MTAARRIVHAVTTAAILLAIGLVLVAVARKRPQDLPWTALDLREAPGVFTAAKLAALGRSTATCQALLDRAGIVYDRTAIVRDGPSCGYADGVRLIRRGPRTIAFSPDRVVMACPVAAGLAMLEWTVLQPAALRHFGQRVARIEHLGSYNCRRIYGRSEGGWSRHATADAIDVSGFILADGTRVSVQRDWSEAGRKGAFLHAVRDGACRLFTTVLSPDYNAAHRDHLHIDHTDRGLAGWRSCR